MISPNCPVIMDATSTTSSYNTIEGSAHSEDMRSNVGDSTDGLTENELLEERNQNRNQDPEDEDTLSDDSLRLRLSDDEGDAYQVCATDVPTASYLSSEQTPSQDTAMGLTDSNGKVPPNDEIKSSMHKSFQPGSNKERQMSKQHNQTLSETHVGGKKSTNSMWRGGSRREQSANNIIHSPKRSLRGHSLHVRYNHSHPNSHKIPSYFNNHNNFGRPPGYRRYKSNWRHSKGKYLHGNTRNTQRNVKEHALNPKCELRSKSVAKTETPVSNESPVHMADSVRHASSNDINNVGDATSPGAVKHRSLGESSEKTLVTSVKKNNDSLPSVSEELSKECSHLNLDKESTVDSKNIESGLRNLSSYNYDSKFTSDNWFDEPHTASDKYSRLSETSSPLLSQGSTDFQGVRPASPVQGTESAVPAEHKNETVIEDSSLPRSSNPSSIDLTMETTESNAGSKSNVAKVDGNAKIEVPHGNKTELDCLAFETTEILNKVIDFSVLSKSHSSEVKASELSSEVAHSEEIETSKERGDNIDEIKEEKEKERSDNGCAKQDLSNKENAESREKTEEKTKVSLSDRREVVKQPMEIVSDDKDAANDTDNQGKKSVSTDAKRKSSLDNKKPIKVAERAPEKPMKLNNIAESESNRLVCNETSDKSSDNSKRNLTETSSAKPDTEFQPLLVTKRSLPDAESFGNQLNHKKMKIATDLAQGVCSKPLESSPGEEKTSTLAEKGQEAPKSLNYVRKFFQRDMKGKLAKLKREELEEFIIQKLVETITMRSEIGRLREQARTSERNQEATRIRCQQLSKQIKDFDMVLNRNAADRRSNNDKPVPPIKINRSVGLQVNFVTDPSIQNLRALSTNNAVKTNAASPVIANGGNTKILPEKINHTTAVRRGLKVRSPRRAEVPKSSPLPIQSQASSATPAALVISKPADTSHNLSAPSNGKEHSLPNVNPAPAATAKVQNIVVNGKISHQVNRQTGLPSNQKAPSNDLIDLTEEEDKNRSTSGGTSGMLPMVGTVTSSIGTKVPHPRFPRVVQGTLPGNVAITTQPANIRVVHSVAQPTPTALVNNINTTRLTYVMQSTPGSGRQLLIAPNPNQIRPATSTTRGQYSNLTYKSGVSTLANGNVRVITTAAPTIPNSQPPPAPLPDTPHYPAKNGLKLPPPPPSLKISKVTQGIVLSWNMAQSENYADIASYQLYAYQEIPGTPPNSNLWKKVGDVRALPLPMACTLKEFTPGNNYHFAVRAVDTHSRLGQYSVPRNISL